MNINDQSHNDYCEEVDTMVWKHIEEEGAKCWTALNAKFITVINQIEINGKTILTNRPAPRNKESVMIEDTLNSTMKDVYRNIALSIKRYVIKTNTPIANRLLLGIKTSTLDMHTDRMKDTRRKIYNEVTTHLFSEAS